MQRSDRAIDLGIVVRDLERMVSFYSGLLGCEPFEEGVVLGGARMLSLHCGLSTLKLLTPGDQPRMGPRAVPLAVSGYRYFTIHVTSVAACVHRVKHAGHDVAVDRTETRPGRWIALVVDPEGNWVELLEE